MIRDIINDKTLLVDGPASVRLASGQAEILNAPLVVGEVTIIRDSKRIPFYVKDEACFDINCLKTAVLEEARGNSIPSSWLRAAERVLASKKPEIIMIVGAADSGKTSLCTYLANSAVKNKRRVAVIDADLGQSDIGPPATVGLAYLKKPIKDLFNIKASEVCFVGSTNPSGASARVLNCIVFFKNTAFQHNADFLVINTDGWIEGKEAVDYKWNLATAVTPNVVMGLGSEKELEPMLSNLTEPLFLKVETPSAVKKRDKEQRKALRELSYKKYLKNSKVRILYLKQIKIDGKSTSPNLYPTDRAPRKIAEILKFQPIMYRESSNIIWIVLERSQKLDLGRLREIEAVFNKKVKIVQQGDEEGAIVGMQNAENKFLGLGVIDEIDYSQKVLKIRTPVSQEVATIQIGNVQLDSAYREIGSTVTLWSQT